MSELSTTTPGERECQKRRSASDTELIILEIIRQRPGCTGPFIAEIVGFQKQSVHKPLQNLQAEGRIRREGNSSASKWYVEEGVPA